MFKPRHFGYGILFFFVLVSFTGCLDLLYSPEIPPEKPRYYKADYDRVWSIAVAYLDSEGYEISQMDRFGGYISTAYKVGGKKRKKIVIKIDRESEGVVVSVIVHKSDEYVSNGKTYWSSGERYGWLEGDILSRIGERLEAK